jgi:hypothetical protein
MTRLLDNNPSKGMTMMNLKPLRLALSSTLMVAAGADASAAVNVTTYHFDTARSGQNTQETTLTTANVNSTQFGKLFSVNVDGDVYAQPLLMSGITTPQGTHNVLYVATEHDSVYALDADTGAVYTQISLIPTGGSTVNSSSDLGCGDLVPEIGITGTPVIDPATNTLYVVAKSKVNGTIVQYLHALDLTNNLTEKFGGPVLIQASVPGTGYDATTVNGQKVVQFNAKQENQRAALLLTNGHVVIGWSSHCDNDPWHGWVISYSASTLTQEAAFNTSPNGQRNGVWMSGGGPAADASGNIYFSTGNGTWSATPTGSGTYTGDFGDSIVKLAPPTGGSFPVLDYFTPYNQATLNGQDNDVAAGGVLLLPTTNGKQLLAQQGKQGTIYLLNTATGSMGKYCVQLSPACSSNDPQIVQEIMAASSGIWGSPAYWNGNLYWTGANDPINAYSVTFNSNGSASISTSPTSTTAVHFAFSAPTPSISANGTTNGILWALDGSADDSTCDGGGLYCLGLYAYDATNLGHLLYSSSQAANNRDSPGTAHKFQTPIIANGKVYVGTVGVVTAYGLLAAAPPTTATPVFSPAPGSYTSTQTVTISDGTSGAVIHYTTNGTTPSTSSPVYSGALTVRATETLQAIAVAPNSAASTVASGVYTIVPPTPPAGSTSVSLASVANVDATSSGAAPIAGGYDGNGNAYPSAVLGSSITFAGSTFKLGTPGALDAASNTTIPLPAGNYSAINLLGSGINGNQPAQTFIVTYTDGTTTTITQSLSDWHTPQNYSGESQVLSTPYRITSAGTEQIRTYYVYGYSLALNSAKTAKSLTLPKNRNVVVIALDVITPATSGGGSTINYPNGFASTTGLNLVGNTVLTGSALELTSGATFQTSAIWNATPVNVQNFTTDFTFQITPASPNTADGLTFTIQNAGAKAIGLTGGGLGYQGLATSIAVKFDLYNNAGEGVDSTGFFVGGAAPFVPALDLTASGVNLHSGDVMHAHLSYNGTTLTLILTDTVTGASFTGTDVVNIPATVGGNSAYVGFTAGTGGSVATQEILTWTYTSGSATSPNAPVINDPNGFASAAGLTLNGATVTSASPGALQLTDGGGTEARAAWAATPVNVQKFTTDFSFQITPAGTQTADGLAFVLQNAGANVVGQTGGALGYAGLGTSVAVKFDLYNNAGEGVDSTGFYTNGAYPSVPALDMTASGINLHSGDVFHAHLTYDGTSLSLTLTDVATGASFTASQAINIPATVGASTAYVGFTGGTGGQTAVQQVLNWTYVVN